LKRKPEGGVDQTVFIRPAVGAGQSITDPPYPDQNGQKEDAQ